MMADDPPQCLARLPSSGLRLRWILPPEGPAGDHRSGPEELMSSARSTRVAMASNSGHFERGVARGRRSGERTRRDARPEVQVLDRRSRESARRRAGRAPASASDTSSPSIDHDIDPA